MSFWKKLFGKKEEEDEGMDDHSVEVHIPIPAEMPTTEEFERYSALEDILGDAAEAAGVGELDGNEIGGNEYTIALFGESAGPLAACVKQELSKHALPPGTYLIARHGGIEDEDAREERIELG